MWGPARHTLSRPLRPAGPSLSEGGPRSSGRLQAQDKLKPEPRGCWKPQDPVCSYSADSALPPAPTARPLIGKLMAGLGGQQEAPGRVWASLASPLCDPGRRFFPSKAVRPSGCFVLSRPFRVYRLCGGQGASTRVSRPLLQGVEANPGGPGPRGVGPGGGECVSDALPLPADYGRGIET